MPSRLRLAAETVQAEACEPCVPGGAWKRVGYSRRFSFDGVTMLLSSKRRFTVLALLGIVSSLSTDSFAGNRFFRNPAACFGNKAEITPRDKPHQSASQRLRRAGRPDCFAPWARCPDDAKYDGYYVGGGSPVRGEPRDAHREGTWGRDYTPWYSRVRLKWWHGRRQGGEGQYEPDRKNQPLRDFVEP